VVVGGGGGGASGLYSIGANGYSAYQQANSFSNDLTINRPGKVPVKVAETLDLILEQLLILQPNFQQMEKYPALKAAYDNYKLIAALTSEENDTDV
jgi:hypothetical protein